MTKAPTIASANVIRVSFSDSLFNGHLSRAVQSDGFDARAHLGTRTAIITNLQLGIH